MRCRAGVVPLLLAGLALGGAAQAADGSAAAARKLTEGLRSCPGGGVALPGSAACLRLSGTVAVETVLATSRPLARFYRGTAAGARIAVDVRVPTDLGPLRLYSSIRAGLPR